MNIRDIPYDVDFYYKGQRYKQILRPKYPKRDFSIYCLLKKDPCSDWIEMPSGLQVKPVIREVGK